MLHDTAGELRRIVLAAVFEALIVCKVSKRLIGLSNWCWFGVDDGVTQRLAP